MKKYIKVLLPVALVTGALVVIVILFLTRPKAERHAITIKEPMVSVMPVAGQDLRIPVFTRGTVTPGTEIPLVSEVSGPVTYVSENFARGGFFKKGEVLIRVDPVEYEVTLKKASAAVAQALQLLEQANAEKRVRSAVKGMTNELGRFEYQYQQAKAQYDAARAELEAVNLQKRKTVLVAPFDGRVRMGSVNPGQYLRPGVQLGLIYAVNAAEVRLPLSDNQLSLVDVPFRFGTEGAEGPDVTLVGDYGGRKYYWKGQVVRAESGVDEYNRLLYVIAQIPDPYAIDVSQPNRPPLTAGNFVEAQIDGRSFENIFVVPRQALRQGAQVWTVNAENRLQRKPVEILHKGKDVVYVKSGLAQGDKVVLSQLDIAVEGMKVRSSVAPLPDEQENSGQDNLLEDGSELDLNAASDDGKGVSQSDTRLPSTSSPRAADSTSAAAGKAAPIVRDQSALSHKVEQARAQWESATPSQKAAAINSTRQTLTTLSEQVRQPAAAIQRDTVSAVDQARQSLSPLADLISETETQMKQSVQAAKTAPVASAPSEPVKPATPRGYTTVPVSAPRSMSEAAQ